MANSKKKKSKVKVKKTAKKAAAKTKRAKAKPAQQKSAVKKLTQKQAPKKVGPKTGKGGSSLKKEITKKLLKDKEDLLAEVAEKIKNESNSLKFEIGDIYDIARKKRERELTLMLGDRDREKLAEIEEALERIKNGAYGICDECGEPIAEARLMALPFTKVCIDCKSKHEREKGARKRYEEEPGLAILEKTEAEEEEF